MDENSIIKSYKRVSGFYDVTFGQVFRPGQKAIIKKMNCSSKDNVLEIGIGTGSSLQYYPDKTKVVGIDLSPDMLDLAKKRIIKDSVQNKHILLMNGEELTFADNTFDKVVGMYVVSVTQDPKKLIEEMKRVCKSDGDIYIVNNIGWIGQSGYRERERLRFTLRYFGYILTKSEEREREREVLEQKLKILNHIGDIYI